MVNGTSSDRLGTIFKLPVPPKLVPFIKRAEEIRAAAKKPVPVVPGRSIAPSKVAVKRVAGAVPSKAPAPPAAVPVERVVEVPVAAARPVPVASVARPSSRRLRTILERRAPVPVLPSYLVRGVSAEERRPFEAARAVAGAEPARLEEFRRRTAAVSTAQEAGALRRDFPKLYGAAETLEGREVVLPPRIVREEPKRPFRFEPAAAREYVAAGFPAEERAIARAAAFAAAPLQPGKAEALYYGIGGIKAFVSATGWAFGAAGEAFIPEEFELGLPKRYIRPGPPTPGVGLVPLHFEPTFEAPAVEFGKPEAVGALATAGEWSAYAGLAQTLFAKPKKIKFKDDLYKPLGERGGIPIKGKKQIRVKLLKSEIKLLKERAAKEIKPPPPPKVDTSQIIYPVSGRGTVQVLRTKPILDTKLKSVFEAQKSSFERQQILKYYKTKQILEFVRKPVAKVVPPPKISYEIPGAYATLARGLPKVISVKPSEKVTGVFKIAGIEPSKALFEEFKPVTKLKVARLSAVEMTLRESVVSAPKFETAVKPVVLTMQRQPTVTREKQATKQITRELDKMASSLVSKTVSKQVSITVPKLTTAEIHRSITGERTATRVRAATAFKFPLLSKLGFKRAFREQREPTRPRIPKIPPLLFPPPKKRARLFKPPKGLLPGFDVLVKKAGAWAKVSPFPLTRKAALGLGAIKTETAARTFFLRPSKRPGRRIPGLEGLWRPERFRAPKGKSLLPKGAFVEKAKFAIDFPTEFEEITLKARKGVRRKKKTKKRKRRYKR